MAQVMRGSTPTFTFVEASAFNIQVVEQFACTHSLEELKKENDDLRSVVEKHILEKAELLETAAKVKGNRRKEKQEVLSWVARERHEMYRAIAAGFERQAKEWQDKLDANLLASWIAKSKQRGVWPSATPRGQHTHTSHPHQRRTHFRFT